jgi:glycosyltransferase involved in cell wall biosynthesis
MISIIVPVYNGENTIKKCIHSLLTQSYPEDQYEIIIVDDGSTDTTSDILKQLDVSVVTQKNQGPAAARNAGARQASGDIILYTDADCIADERWIEEMVAPFGDPEIVGVKGAYKTKQLEPTAKFAQAEFEDRYRKLLGYEYIDFVDTYAAAFRKDIFLDVGGFDPSFPLPDNEDVDLSYRLSEKGHKMAFNPRAFVYHRHPKTVWKYCRTKFWRAFWRIAVYKRFPDKIVQDTYTPQTLKLQILLFYLLICLIAATFINTIFVYGIIITLITFLFTTIPFMYHVMRKDIWFSGYVPFFILARASSLGMGILYALLFGKGALPPTPVHHSQGNNT